MLKYSNNTNSHTSALETMLPSLENFGSLVGVTADSSRGMLGTFLVKYQVHPIHKGKGAKEDWKASNDTHGTASSESLC